MSLAHHIVDITNGQIEWVIFYVSRSYRDSGFIASEDDGQIHDPFVAWIIRKYLILEVL